MLVTMIFSTLNYEKEADFYSYLGFIFVSIFIIQLIFFSVGMFTAAVNKRYKKSGNISVGILMITFLISSLINMLDSVDFLKYITPIKYFDATCILE